MPPSAYGTFLGANDDSTVDIFTAGRKMRVSVHPEVDVESMARGQEVANESLNVVLARGPPSVSGEVVILKELLEGKDLGRLIVGRADEERVCELGATLLGEKLRAGDHLLMEAAPASWSRLPRPRSRNRTRGGPRRRPTTTWWSRRRDRAIKDAVELP